MSSPKTLSHGDRIIQALTALDAGTIDAVPKGFLTTKQWAKELGNCSRETATVKLRRLLEAGKVETKAFRIRVGNITRSVPHYRILP